MFTRECVYKHSYADLCDLITYEEIADNVGALIVFCHLDLMAISPAHGQLFAMHLFT